MLRTIQQEEPNIQIYSQVFTVNGWNKVSVLAETGKCCRGNSAGSCVWLGLRQKVTQPPKVPTRCWEVSHPTWVELFISLCKLGAPLTVLLKKKEKESNIHDRHEKGPSLTAHCRACWEGWILNLYRIKNCKEQQCQYLAGSHLTAWTPASFFYFFLSLFFSVSSPRDCGRSAGSEKASHTPKVTQQQTVVFYLKCGWSWHLLPGLLA